MSVTQTDLLFCRLDAVHAPAEFINFSSDRNIYRLALFSHLVMRVLDRERERERERRLTPTCLIECKPTALLNAGTTDLKSLSTYTVIAIFRPDWGEGERESVEGEGERERARQRQKEREREREGVQ